MTCLPFLSVPKTQKRVLPAGGLSRGLSGFGRGGGGGGGDVVFPPTM
jgi:hypothetical protein